MLRSKAIHSAVFAIVFGLSLVACDYNPPEAYEPRAGFEEFKKAKSTAASAVNAEPVDPIASAKKTYNIYCASCHGPDGKAATPTAMALNPKPRNLTDKEWQASVDDAHIYKVIDEGGSAVGLSASMAAWGGALDKEQMEGLVRLVRDFGN